jgi:CPA2 family monovalent cation:H+ antiporter-2
VLSVLVLEDVAMAAFLPLLVVRATGGTWWQGLAAFTAAYVITLAVVGPVSTRLMETAPARDGRTRSRLTTPG